jgi:hypothetical protein
MSSQRDQLRVDQRNHQVDSIVLAELLQLGEIFGIAQQGQLNFFVSDKQRRGVPFGVGSEYLARNSHSVHRLAKTTNERNSPPGAAEQDVDRRRVWHKNEFAEELCGKIPLFCCF